MTSRRLHSHTYDVRIPIGEGFHDLKITVAYYAGGGVHEIAYVGRGKAGHGLDQLLVELGIATSRAIQGRDPNTGEFKAWPIPKDQYLKFDPRPPE